MTLIVADLEAGRVVMGADSALGAIDEVYTRPHVRKIYRAGPYLVGVCGSTRVSQVLQVMDWPPPPDDTDLERFMIATVAPAIRQAVAAAAPRHPGWFRHGPPDSRAPSRPEPASVASFTAPLWTPP